MRQWEVHIGAMNQLIDGEITLQQATRFWNETRRAAAGRPRECTAAAHRDYKQRAARCGPAASQVAEIGRCVRLIGARNRTIHSATVAWTPGGVHAEQWRCCGAAR